MGKFQPTQIASLGVFVVLGTLVLASYGLLVAPIQRGVDLWYGIPPSVQYVYYGFMGAAAVGLCTLVGWYCFTPTLPTRGVFSKPWAMPIVLAVALLASAAWSAAVASPHQQPWLVSASLIAVAIAAILLLAGAVEADTRTWFSVLGALAFAACTVLSDGVAWNANYLLHTAEQTRA